MDISDELTAELKMLTDALDLPGVDLSDLIAGLVAQTQRTITSYLGLTLTLVVDDYPATFSIPAEFPRPPKSSVSLPLDLVSSAEPGSCVVFYAAAAGAFVDFAADVAFVTGVPLTDIGLDTGLDGPAIQSNLSVVSQINQAVGVLIERGHTQEEARAYLAKLSAEGAGTLAAAAQSVIESVSDRT